MSISFKSIKSSARLLNPFKDFALDEITFEIRRDPLTGETGRVFNLPYKPSAKPNLKKTIQKSKEMFCPFCPEQLTRSTPLFPDDLIPNGRIRYGQATLIPNLIPFDIYSGVSILSGQHFIPIEDLRGETMMDAFLAAVVFIRRIIYFDPSAHFFYINCNYMPPSGSSLVHPHLQVNCGYIPTNYHRMQINGCKRYWEKNKKSFWENFLSSEKESGKRYIGESGSTFWVMSFVPQTFLPDIWCIFPEHHSLAHLEKEEISSFLQGFSRVLEYMASENINSFNFSIFSSKEDDSVRINAKICPRLLPRAIGNSDRSYLQLLHKEAYSIKPPESICKKVKEFFNRQQL